MSPSVPLRYGWHAESYSPKMASIRLRLLEPAAALRRRGLDIGPYRGDLGPVGYAAILFSKSLSQDALGIAREARSLGRAVIYDLSDNLFAGKLARKDKQDKLARLREMLALATCVTFPTPTLMEQVQAAVPEIAGKGRVIPDVIDCAREGAEGRSLLERYHLARLKRFLAAHGDALHCVWFGKSQGSVSGFAHLDSAVRQLERFSLRHPVTLTVISNRRLRYWKSAANWRLPTHYMPWAIGSFHEALALHRVAVIPVERNGYTVGKSVNRPATAIAAGLGVVADAIDSYEELRPFIPLDDWQGGLQRYLARPPAEDPDLLAAAGLLRQRYSPDAVAARWEGLLAEASALCGAAPSQAARNAPHHAMLVP